MNYWDSTFDTYSNRPMPPGKRKALTTTFKNRILHLCTKCYPQPDTEDFWSGVYDMLAFNTGEFSQVNLIFPYEGVKSLLVKCDDDIFLDFVEYIFKVQTREDFVGIPKISTDDINRFFVECDLPYYLTELEKKRQEIVGHPKVIARDSEVLHQMSIKPTLNLLKNNKLQGANQEFMDALQHYRKNEFGHCVAMCGSSFESVMKTICIAKGWEKKPDSLTGSDLLKIITKESNLKSYYRKLTELTHVIRDNESTVHGGREEIRNPPQHIAQFVINMTASTILVLVDQVGL